MAQYNVLSNGNAPKGLSAGSIVNTAGGQFQILDADKYSGYTPDQLAKAGVSYNPNNGYYSKKVGDLSNTNPAASYSSSGNLYSNFSPNPALLSSYTNNIKTIDTAPLDSWKNNYINQQVAQIESDYNNNLNNLNRSYNTNLAGYLSELNTTKNDYRKNIDNVYKSAYNTTADNLNQMANRGMTSAAQGMAMNTANLVNANNTVADLVSDRDTLMDNIRNQINTLGTNYRNDKDTLAANLSKSKLEAMSTAELQYISQMLDIERANNDAYNNAVAQALQDQYQTYAFQNNADLQKYLQDDEQEAALDYLAKQYELNSRYGGSGGYGGYGGYRGYGGYGRGSGSSNGSYNQDLDDYYQMLVDASRAYDGNLEAQERHEKDVEKWARWADKHPNATKAEMSKAWYNVDSSAQQAMNNKRGARPTAKDHKIAPTPKSNLEKALTLANKISKFFNI